MHTAVIVSDRTQHPRRIGSLVRGNEISRLEATSVVVLLPVEPPLTPDNHRSALRSHFLRFFGDDEVLLKGDAPTRCCGMALEAQRDLPYLHWLVCIAAAGRNPRAAVSLTTDPGNGFMQQGSLDDLHPSRAVLEPGDLQLPTDWSILGGRARLSLAVDGIAGFSLQASGNDVAILWCAVSQCAEPRPMKCLDP